MPAPHRKRAAPSVGGLAGVIATAATGNGGPESHFSVGSGGGGAAGFSTSDIGGGGAAGGGAIRIVANSYSFATNTSIQPRGGSATVGAPAMNCLGGAGAGGSIHIVAPAPVPTLGFVSLDARGGFGQTSLGTNQGGNGLIRISTGDTSCSNCNLSVVFGPPFTPPLQTGTPKLQIVSIGGQGVPAEPTGSYVTPDVTLNTNSPVAIQIASSNLPVNTVVTLRITNEVQADQTISCAPLSGTLANATATCSATYAQLGSMTSIRAVW